MPEITVNISLLDTQDQPQPWNKDDLDSVANLILRDHLVRSAGRVLGLFDIQNALDQIGPITVAPGTIPPRPSELLALQDAQFKNLGITTDGPLFLFIPVEDGGFEFRIETLENTWGSFLSRKRILIAWRATQKFTTEFARELAVALLAHAILTGPAEAPPLPSPSYHYACTIDSNVSGVDREKLIALPIQDLVLASNMSATQRQKVITARQVCLRAAGFYPGPIDGIDGPQTQKAAGDFAYFHGNIIINWNSPVFLRLLVIKAMEHRGGPSK